MLPRAYEVREDQDLPELAGLAMGRRGPVWAAFITNQAANCCYPDIIAVRHRGQSWSEPMHVGTGTPGGIATDSTGRTATIAGWYYGAERDEAVLDSWDGSQWIRQRAEGEPDAGANYLAIDADARGGRWAVGLIWGAANQPLVAYQCRPLEAG